MPNKRAVTQRRRRELRPGPARGRATAIRERMVEVAPDLIGARVWLTLTQNLKEPAQVSLKFSGASIARPATYSDGTVEMDLQNREAIYGIIEGLHSLVHDDLGQEILNALPALAPNDA